MLGDALTRKTQTLRRSTFHHNFKGVVKVIP
jgi:hypothetical protein